MDTTRRDRKKNKTHSNLLHSAKVLFEAKGIDNVTLSDICEEADVAKSTFFLHFDSLEHLMLQLVSDEIDDLCGSLNSAEMDSLVLTLGDKFIADFAAYPTLSTKLFINAVLSDKAQNIKQVYELFSKYMEREPRYAEARKQLTAETLTASIAGCCIGLIIDKFIRKQPFDTQELKNEFLRIEGFFASYKKLPSGIDNK